ncbi:MAG: hypothetical protein HYS13_04660 [Planctomycetia bacterium]|nr:hypothetical protein [Planctomycetia bacterium]
MAEKPKHYVLYDEAEKLKDAGDLEGAVARLNEAVALEPSFGLAHAALAVHYGRLQRHDDAIRHGLKVCELEPNDPFSFTALSVVYVRAGKIMEAEEAKYRAAMLGQQRQH